MKPIKWGGTMSASPAAGGENGFFQPVWIIAPRWDLMWFAATPLVVAPLVAALQQVWTAERIWLAAMAFFSLGHHLPGFLRAYGDADLFARFRTRLIVVPPLLFAVSLLCEAKHWHALRCLIVFWATWHGLMQTYGFLRIYSVKSGDRSAATARRDFWATTAVFVGGFVLSDGRMLNLLQTLWNAGAPESILAAVAPLRWGAALGLAGAAVWYVAGLFHDRRERQRLESQTVSEKTDAAQRMQPAAPWNKLLLLASTAAIWGWTGSSAVDVLVGVAMFEVYHAVQYLAIVWVFNAKGAQRWAAKLAGPTGELVGGACGIGIYLVAIAAFGSLRYVAGGLGGDGGYHQAAGVFAAALLSTSTLLHYYFDGFIWKVREQGNQEKLGVPPGAADAKAGIAVPPAKKNSAFSWSSGLGHALKWGAFFAPLGLLVAAQERLGPDQGGLRAYRQAEALAAWSPHSAEAQLQFAERALDLGRWDEAKAAAQAGVRLRPTAWRGWSVLGSVELEQGRLTEAEAAYRHAAELAPHDGRTRFNRAGALAALKQWDAAEAEYRQALALDPRSTLARDDLAGMYLLRGEELAQSGKPAEAVSWGTKAVALRPNHSLTELQAGLWKAQSGDAAGAKQAFARAALADPTSAAPHLAWAETAWIELQPWRRAGWTDLVAPALAEAEAHLAAAAELGTAGPPALVEQVRALRAATPQPSPPPQEIP